MVCFLKDDLRFDPLILLSEGSLKAEHEALTETLRQLNARREAIFQEMCSRWHGVWPGDAIEDVAHGQTGILLSWVRAGRNLRNGLPDCLAQAQPLPQGKSRGRLKRRLVTLHPPFKILKRGGGVCL